MRHKHVLIVTCLCLSVFVENSFGRIGPNTSDVERIVTIIEKAARDLGYRAMRGYRPTDEWEAEEKKSLVESHAYYTLFGKDSDNSCIGAKGRIGITILIFRDENIARRQVLQMKEYHLDNIGVEVLKDDKEGYHLQSVNGFHSAVISGSRVILFQDWSRTQGEVLQSLSQAVVKGLR